MTLKIEWNKHLLIIKSNLHGVLLDAGSTSFRPTKAPKPTRPFTTSNTNKIALFPAPPLLAPRLGTVRGMHLGFLKLFWMKTGLVVCYGHDLHNQARMSQQAESNRQKNWKFHSKTH